MKLRATLAALALAPWASSAAAQTLPPRLEVIADAATLGAPLTLLATAPSDPQVLYLASGDGAIFVSQDAGLHWERRQISGSKQEAPLPSRATLAPPLSPVYSPFSLDGLGRPSRVLNLSSPLEQVSNVLSFRGGLQTQAVEDRFDASLQGWEPLLEAPPGGWEGFRLWGGGWPDEEAPIASLAVSPARASALLAAQGGAVWRSQDGGLSWVLSLAGDRKDQEIKQVIYHPKEPGIALAASDAGLWRSFDGGQRWALVEGLRGEPLEAAVFHPEGRAAAACGEAGLWLSDGDGARWAKAWGEGCVGVAFDGRGALIVLGEEGLWAGSELGKGLVEVGRAALHGEAPVAVTSAGSGRVVVATRSDLWESVDGGARWAALSFGRSRWESASLSSGARGGALWWVTQGALLRLSARPPEAAPPDLLARWRRLTAGEPGAAEAVEAALARAGVVRGALTERRQDAALKNLLPQVEASWLYFSQRSDNGRSSLLLGGRPTASGALEPQLRLGGPANAWSAFVNLRWGLEGLVWDPAEAPSSGADARHREAEARLREVTLALYLERRRLQLEMILEPEPEARVGLMRALRLEELTAWLNLLTGDLFTHFEALSGAGGGR